MRCHCRGRGKGRRGGCSAEDPAKLVGALHLGGVRSGKGIRGAVGLRRCGPKGGVVSLCGACAVPAGSLSVFSVTTAHVHHMLLTEAPTQGTQDAGVAGPLSLNGCTSTFTVSLCPRLANAVTINNWTSLM